MMMRRRAIILFVLGVIATVNLLNYLLVNSDQQQTNKIDSSEKFVLHTSPADRTSSYWDTVFHSDKLMTGSQILEYFKWSNRSSCDLVQYFGGFLRGNPRAKDGIKAVCLDPAIAPDQVDCLVYSFGINFDWTFDEDMVTYGCEVFAFDPSINKSNHDHKPFIHFFNWGLGHFNGKGSGSKSGWEMHTLSHIYEELSKFHDKNRTIDYLKVDIEGDEWTVIPQLIQSGMLSKVRQMGIEIHLKGSDLIERIRQQVGIVRSLETAGMVRFDSMLNPWVMEKFLSLNATSASSAWDLSFYNSRFLTPSSVS